MNWKIIECEVNERAKHNVSTLLMICAAVCAFTGLVVYWKDKEPEEKLRGPFF